MKKLFSVYRQEMEVQYDKEMQAELKSNYKDYVNLSKINVAEESKKIEIEPLIGQIETPVYMSIQVADTGKPKW